MIKDLQAIYPSLVLLEPQLEISFELYTWFETGEGETIGIKKEELSSNESELLSAFLRKTNITKRPLTKREKWWSRILFQQETTFAESGILRYRFIFFQADSHIKDVALFEEGFEAIFPFQMPVIWLSGSQGFIVEEFLSNDQVPVPFEEVIDVLMSDLYIKIRLFVGEVNEKLENAQEQYSFLQHISPMVFAETKQNVVYLKDALSQVLIQQVEDKRKQQMVDAILKDTVEDEELLKTIRVFLESNSNVTEAAKRMYMHRNSLQYRIDKFVEQTGIDIKSFEGAVTTYLTLQMMD
ncbi:hypothetical protein HNQ94_002114 [Salirhabdus euzebyi]|uniref:PucR C-terminal helix-turn-helix domain-containing protein n=1 Tax=Salirhabdus euzebyi TaxID=394506 RepID=A0A841Q5J9_9BACI|nr:helix-turn-helix domain-containing protein [Salirhabdus euzebyi]MBB6453665.1 hypothetical protein [Salirhabdus euzebyi]